MCSEGALHSYCSRGEDDGDDQTEEADSLGENEDQNHADEELGLDGVHAYTNVSDHTNGKARGLYVV